MPPKKPGTTLRRECLFDECMLNSSNKGYLFQCVFLIIAILCLNTFADFNATAILLFTIPLLIDLCNANLVKSAPRTIRIILIILNSIIFVGCFLAFVGPVKEYDTKFDVSHEVLGFDINIHKTLIAWILAAESMIIPLIMMWGIPTKKTVKNISIAKKMAKGV